MDTYITRVIMKMHIFIFFISSMYLHVGAINNQEFFLQAQQEYKQSHFENALSLYQKMPHKNAIVWYNMGNSLYQLGNDLDALLHWKRAYHYGSGAVVYESAANIDHIQNKLGLTESNKVQSFWKGIQKMIKAPSMLQLQILFFCIFSVFLFFGCRWYVKRNYFLLTSLFMMLVLVASTLGMRYRELSHTPALIMKDNSVLLAGPDLKYHELSILNAGACIEILEQRNGWCKVSSNNQNGWLQKKDIELI